MKLQLAALALFLSSTVHAAINWGSVDAAM